MNVGAGDFRIQGRVLRIARLEAEAYLFLDDGPEQALAALRQSRARADLFTFTQRVPYTAPKYRYPMEWDNCAAIHITTFDQWWREQINNKTRNRARLAEKKGVVIREAPFDRELVNGIWEIYNEVPVRRGRRFPHYGEDLETVYAEEATFLENSWFIGAYLEEKLIGFIKLTADATRTQANVMNILS